MVGFSWTVIDAEAYVPQIYTFSALASVLQEVKLCPSEEKDRKFVADLQATGLGGQSRIGIKKLLSVVETARQEPANLAQRLQRALEAAVHEHRLQAKSNPENEF
ncbi:hypothetical protein LshimejAT787_1802490 [Lyophyllum shimeji]|uniref:Uncharacterized protein n=1 Tax=Lyophyllum shimeji TaxID=47721 RepID=A0A9P3Q147_LYOSH|nr:hypothetical protein LshimejAT787_1802490 [Lyophyllum shimeji]